MVRLGQYRLRYRTDPFLVDKRQPPLGRLGGACELCAPQRPDVLRDRDADHAASSRRCPLVVQVPHGVQQRAALRAAGADAVPTAERAPVRVPALPSSMVREPEAGREKARHGQSVQDP
jgi:hypothetical protein